MLQCCSSILYFETISINTSISYLKRIRWYYRSILCQYYTSILNSNTNIQYYTSNVCTDTTIQNYTSILYFNAIRQWYTLILYVSARLQNYTIGLTWYVTKLPSSCNIEKAWRSMEHSLSILNSTSPTYNLDARLSHPKTTYSSILISNSAMQNTFISFQPHHRPHECFMLHWLSALCFRISS